MVILTLDVPFFIFDWFHKYGGPKVFGKQNLDPDDWFLSICISILRVLWMLIGKKIVFK
jgi:hypothetical protein